MRALTQKANDVISLSLRWCGRIVAQLSSNNRLRVDDMGYESLHNLLFTLK